ncbi:hemerythrin domain-containing protein [Streptomyces sp. BA2]|uniref:hemerythrin domain-containing protein n=1 Tax=Streptomyces sp. BA2 TaxID=436595 RepID=UPI001324BC6F|nr:hemerythrin domain-containing protein [Streptomyces sp. BA2]MWA13355.1 hemerythrin domain-containing protein [Streptomyces sp. BA2]
MTESIAHLPSGHQTMLLAHRAMVRDLDRVARSAEQLARTPDAEQAAALLDYVDKLFQVIEHHHEGEDDFLWPRLRELGADQEALALMTAEHEELAKVLHTWHETSKRLGTDPAVAAELAKRTEEVREQLAGHAGDEERELLGRLAPALGKQIWKGFATHMRKTAPGWTLRFMPAWLLSVAGPGEQGGVAAAPIGRLFSGWLEKRQRAAFGENY